MIWLWICAAWLLSFAVLKNKKIEWEHLIWLLLPVDMYGIPIGGITVKPYMLLCLLIVVRFFLQRKKGFSIKSRWSIGTGALVILMFLVNMINNDSSSSITSIFLLPLVWICSMIYVSTLTPESESQIPDVILAAGIGFGAVLCLACVLNDMNVRIDGIVTRIRQNPGMIMAFYNMNDGMLVRIERLRGFSIDPNTMGCTFFFAAIVAVLRIMKRKAGWREYLALILGGYCVVRSNSRMGMICFALVVIVCVAVGYRTADIRTRNRTKMGILAAIAILILMFVMGFLTPLLESFLAQFSNRSGLNDEYGRFSIWEEAISVLLKENPLFGIGFGQMQYYTQMNRACHNTWLEVLAAGGFLVGGTFLIQFMALAYAGLRHPFENKEAGEKEVVWTMVLGLLVVMISLFGVDHLMYSYLWFTAAVVAAFTHGSRRGL